MVAFSGPQDGGRKIQGHPWLLSKFKASLGYIRPVSTTNTQGRKSGLLRDIKDPLRNWISKQEAGAPGASDTQSGRQDAADQLQPNTPQATRQHTWRRQPTGTGYSLCFSFILFKDYSFKNSIFKDLCIYFMYMSTL